MNFKLCYKSYDCKMNLAAMKLFEESTGKDLWATLMELWHEYQVNKGQPILEISFKLYQKCGFKDGSYALYAMARQENSAVTIEEIQDAMLRVGWRPSENDDDMSNPYTLILVDLALKVDEYFQNAKEKKL